MKLSKITQVAGAVALALSMSAAYAADNNTSEPMTGKQKATAIGATTGAVAGAVVGGPVGAVVGAGIGGVVGHQGTDANGKVTSTPSDSQRATHADGTPNTAYRTGSDSSVMSAQAALNSQGYSAGTPDGIAGPNTEAAIRKFQADKGLAQTGMLDSATRSALGVN